MSLERASMIFCLSAILLRASSTLHCFLSAYVVVFFSMKKVFMRSVDLPFVFHIKKAFFSSVLWLYIPHIFQTKFKKVKHATPRNKWSVCWCSSSITYLSPLEGHCFSRSSAYQWVRIYFYTHMSRCFFKSL